MKTSKRYQQAIKERVITTEMLVDCLYSVNKRAKNYRDQERRYRAYRHDRYHNEEQCRYKKEEFYGMKEKLLSIVPPTCIHVEYADVRKRYYDYEPYYYDIVNSSKIIYQNEYYDRDIDDIVCFVDIVEKEPRFYLFYDLGQVHTFHTPIDNPERYSLPIVEIDQLVTKGDDIVELVSVQFVQKVLLLIESADFTYIESAPS